MIRTAVIASYNHDLHGQRIMIRGKDHISTITRVERKIRSITGRIWARKRRKVQIMHIFEIIILKVRKII